MIIRTETPICDSGPEAGSAGPFRLIPVGKGRYCYVDEADYAYLNQFRWTVKMSNSRAYVVRRVRSSGHDTLIRMHREIMQTPAEMQCHHRDFDTFNNRRLNLVTMDAHCHQALHVERRIRLMDKPVLRRARDMPILAPASFPANNEGTPSEKK